MSLEKKTLMGNKITVAQAAALLGVSNRRVVAMIGAGILEAEKFGEKVWQVNAESVERRRKEMEQKQGEP
jgi:excisionase family DNA binding protein